MKRAYSSSAYARPCEQYCREHYPEEAAQIFRRAEDYYRQFQKDMPDLGKNVMAQNMLDWFTILSFYEATGRRMDGEVLLEIKRRAVDKWKFLGKFIDGNRNQWPYRLFEKVYGRYIKKLQAHQARGEWMDTWRIENQSRRPYRGLLLSSHRLPHRQTRQSPRLWEFAALSVPDGSSPYSGHARPAHPHPDRSPGRRILRLLVRGRPEPRAGAL